MNIRVLGSSSAGNAVLLEDEAGTLLLDAGLDFKRLQRGTGFGIARLSGCLVTHEHMDHARAVPKLLQAGVNVYATPGTLNYLVPAAGPHAYRLLAVRPLEAFSVQRFRVVAFPTVHDAAEPVGFVVASPTAKVLYLTDSAYSPFRFQGLTHILIEANFSLAILEEKVEAGMPAERTSRIIRNHLSLERCLDLLRANDLSSVEEIHLLHMSDGNSDETAFVRAVEEATGLPVFAAPR